MMRTKPPNQIRTSNLTANNDDLSKSPFENKYLLSGREENETVSINSSPQMEQNKDLQEDDLDKNIRALDKLE